MKEGGTKQYDAGEVDTEAWRSLEDSPAGRLLTQLYGKSKPFINYPVPRSSRSKSACSNRSQHTFSANGGESGIHHPQSAESQHRPFIKVPHFTKRSSMSSEDEIDDNYASSCSSSSRVALIPRRKAASASAHDVQEIDNQRRFYRPPCRLPVATDGEKKRLNEIFTHKGGKALPEELLYPVGPTPTELADERKHQAERMKNEIEAGVILPEHLRKKDTPNESLFKMIVEEIDERASHIAQMEALGGQSPYDVIRIRGEIAQRLRELEKIDPHRAREFMNRL